MLYVYPSEDKTAGMCGGGGGGGGDDCGLDLIQYWNMINSNYSHAPTFGMQVFETKGKDCHRGDTLVCRLKAMRVTSQP